MHWQKQLELKEAGIDTGMYRKAKKRLYAATRNHLLFDRKNGELERMQSKTPLGRRDHVVRQIDRFGDHSGRYKCLSSVKQ
jgi:hypothetical protein